MIRLFDENTVANLIHRGRMPARTAGQIETILPHGCFPFGGGAVPRTMQTCMEPVPQSAIARVTPPRARLGCGRKSDKVGRAYGAGGSPATSLSWNSPGLRGFFEGE